MEARQAAGHPLWRPAFIALCARLIIFSMAMQFAAVDHWGGGVDGVVGVVGSDQHTSHCHGALGSCGAEQGALAIAETQPRTVVPATWTLSSLPGETEAASSVAVPPPDRPPRSLSIA